MNDILVTCPHCNIHVLIPIKETNCRIFRHATYKSNNIQVNPHMIKVDCDKLIECNLVNGCCKPFKLNENNIAIICDYI